VGTEKGRFVSKTEIKGARERCCDVVRCSVLERRTKAGDRQRETEHVALMYNGEIVAALFGS
jgi:hypothetical protein